MEESPSQTDRFPNLPGNRKVRFRQNARRPANGKRKPPSHGGRLSVILPAGYSSKEWITTPERSLGSNHVVLGGMMFPVSAMLMSCCIETG